MRSFYSRKSSLAEIETRFAASPCVRLIQNKLSQRAGKGRCFVGRMANEDELENESKSMERFNRHVVRVKNRDEPRYGGFVP